MPNRTNGMGTEPIKIAILLIKFLLLWKLEEYSLLKLLIRYLTTLKKSSINKLKHIINLRLNKTKRSANGIDR